MSILLISGCQLCKAPYVQYYLDILDKNNIEYDVIAWHRGDCQRLQAVDTNYHIYNYDVRDTSNFIKKLLGYWRFSRFVKKNAKQYKSDAVIIFSIPTVIFFYRWLIKKYNNRYIFDVRDYSSFYKKTILKNMINRIIKHSFTTCLSSPGFLKWLPKFPNKYTISHNIRNSFLPDNEQIEIKGKKTNELIKILTIGLIRDPETNLKIAQSVCALQNMQMTFVGYGFGLDFIRKEIDKKNIHNVIVKGAYEKKDEPTIVNEYDMINAYMPNNILSNTLMSNRFYLSVMHGKPLIVTEGSVQAEYVKEYKLGVVISDINNIGQNIQEYWDKFDIEEYNKGRKRFIEVIKRDYSVFENKIEEFINSKKE